MKTASPALTGALMAAGVLGFVFLFGVVGTWDYRDQLAQEQLVADRNAQLQAMCLPGAPGEVATIEWRRSGDLKCVVQPEQGRARGYVLKGSTWTPL